jgi:hypothetical protein
MSKTRDDRTLSAVRKLWTHALAWEVRLEINGDLQRSEVLRSQDDVLTASESWKAAILEKSGTGSFLMDGRWESAQSSLMAQTDNPATVLPFAEQDGGDD